MPISKREANTILQSLAAGVVPRYGLRHIAVGRSKEIASLVQNLDHIRDGGTAIRFIIGRYGSGKSFLLQLMRTYALENRMVVADADLSTQRRLQGSGGQALATYRELMHNLSTQTRPDGNALPVIIERWISTIQGSVAQKSGGSSDSSQLSDTVSREIVQTINKMQELVHGFDFGVAINAYYRGFIDGDDNLKNSAIRWLRGEFQTRSEAREFLGVRTIIDDDNYYDYLKALSRFSREVGYSGVLICLDQADILYKISHTQARNSNYERLLTIVNDCLQGRAGYFGFFISGTPEFLEDSRRGLFSYEALRSRLASSQFSTSEMRDYSAPVISLPPLSPEEVFVLLQKIRDIHRENVLDSRPLDDSAIVAFMEESLRGIGAKEFTTPRDLVREFINVMNLMAQYPEKSWQDILQGIPKPAPSKDDEILGDSTEDGSSDPIGRFTDMQTP
jgi:hypothetical protein